MLYVLIRKGTARVPALPWKNITVGNKRKADEMDAGESGEERLVEGEKGES